MYQFIHQLSNWAINQDAINRNALQFNQSIFMYYLNCQPHTAQVSASQSKMLMLKDRIKSAQANM